MTAAFTAFLLVLLTGNPSSRRRLHGLDRTSRTFAAETWLLVLVPVAGLVVLGPVGLVVGIVLLPVARRLLQQTESAQEARDRSAFEEQVPHVLDLVAAVVEVGSPVSNACRTVAEHLDGRMRNALFDLADELEQRRDIPGRPATEPPMWTAVERTLVRSQDSGASVIGTLERVAEDARREHAARRKTDAQRVAVRTAAPLGLCFLPAFLLVGVAPGLLSLVLEHLL